VKEDFELVLGEFYVKDVLEWDKDQLYWLLGVARHKVQRDQYVDVRNHKTYNMQESKCHLKT
jgi:hypothetical protein